MKERCDSIVLTLYLTPVVLKLQFFDDHSIVFGDHEVPAYSVSSIADMAMVGDGGYCAC